MAIAVLLADAQVASESRRRCEREPWMAAFLSAKTRRTIPVVNQKRRKAGSLVTASQARRMQACRAVLYRETCEAHASFCTRRRMRPNIGFQLTPLCGPKIVAFLKVGIGSTAFPIYRGGAAEA